MAEDKSSDDLTRELTERINNLESLVREQVARLYALERRVGLPINPPALEPRTPHPDQLQTATPLQPAPPLSPPQRARSQPAPPMTSPAAPAPAWPPTRNAQSPALNAQPSAKRPRASLEARIGGNWFNRIGMLAIALGVGFFLKYAFDNEWIGPVGRVSIGFLIGAGFLIGGELLRERGYKSYAAGLSGGGILILYLSIFAAFSFYELIGQLPAFILMAAVTATTALLSARYDALPIAILGLIGGFLTPILLSTGVDNQVGLFGYIALLDAGVLALAYSKHWRSLNYLAFGATVLMFAGWLLEWYEREKLAPTMFFLTLFFVLFALLAILYNVINRRQTTWLDLLLTLANALLYFSTSYVLLDESYRGMLGAFAVLMSIFYLGLGYFTYSRDREDRLLIYTFLGLAFMFLVLAVPIQLDQHWVTMGWAIEGAVLTWIGLKANDRASLYGSLVVFAIAVFHWVVIDAQNLSPGASTDFLPLLNRRGLSCAVLIASLAAAAWLHNRFPSPAAADEQSIFREIYILAANGMAITLLSLDVNDYFKSSAYRQGVESSVWWESPADEARHFMLTALWAVYAAIMLVMGIRRNLRALRYAALLLLGLGVFNSITANLAFYGAQWHLPLFNQTFASFAFLIAAMACGAFYYSQADSISERERTAMIGVLVGAANIFAIIAFSAEAVGYFDKQLSAATNDSDALRDVELAKQLSLSMIWMIYGGVMLTLGIIRGNALLRWMALALLGLTIGKVFLIDLASLDRFYRIISFIVLGAILLGVSFLYQRLRQRAAEPEAGDDAVG